MLGISAHGCDPIIMKAIDKYMQLDIDEGDEIMYTLKKKNFANKEQCKRPNQFMNKPEKICVILTRIAYLLGSSDNLTSTLIVNEQYLL